MPTLYTGTSGYSYKEWKGAFYPQKLPQTRFLEYYAERLNTVELNNTFYRFPGSTMLEGWGEGTPDSFRFAVKAHQKITHRARLADIAGFTQDFVERCRVLGAKLGPILFQLPPNFKRDDARLAEFLETLPRQQRYAMEFRHASWFDDTVMSALTGAGVAWCVSEGDKLDTPRAATSGFCYLRLRRDHYDESDLDDWRGWIADCLADGRDVYAYLKHDEAGVSPERALKLLANPD